MAVLSGCRVVNMSFGYTGSKAPTNVINAISNNPSTLFVVAALNGDGPQDISRDWLPNAKLQNVICVNSFNKAGEVFYSGVGTNVFISAPGRRVLVQIGGTNYSTSGTSYAAPHVTGVIALMMARYTNMPSWAVKTRLRMGAETNVYWQNKNTCGGMLNAYKALYRETNALVRYVPFPFHLTNLCFVQVWSTTNIADPRPEGLIFQSYGNGAYLPLIPINDESQRFFYYRTEECSK
jgi:subtilisin family serine protease